MHIMEFEWHDAKAKINFEKHGVSFEEAISCFYDPLQLVFFDPDHSDDEDREIMLAHSEKGHLLVVIYTLRNEVIRIISVRCATQREARDYAKRI